MVFEKNANNRRAHRCALLFRAVTDLKVEQERRITVYMDLRFVDSFGRRALICAFVKVHRERASQITST